MWNVLEQVNFVNPQLYMLVCTGERRSHSLDNYRWKKALLAAAFPRASRTAQPACLGNDYIPSEVHKVASW